MKDAIILVNDMYKFYKVEKKEGRGIAAMAAWN